MTAEASGRIDIGRERRCVYRDASDETIPDTPIVFVFGTQLVDSEQPYIQLPDGANVQTGDRVTITGGWIAAETTAQIPFLSHLDIPETCWVGSDAKPEILLVSPFDGDIKLEL